MTRSKASQGWNKPLEKSLERGIKSSCFHKHQGPLQPRIPKREELLSCGLKNLRGLTSRSELAAAASAATSSFLLYSSVA